MSDLSELAEEAAEADDSVWFKDNCGRIIQGSAEGAQAEDLIEHLREDVRLAADERDRLWEGIKEDAEFSLAAEKRLVAERDALLAEVAKVRQDYHDAAGELLVDIGDAQPGTLVAKLLTANRIMARERDALRVEVETLKAAARVLIDTHVTRYPLYQERREALEKLL